MKKITLNKFNEQTNQNGKWNKTLINTHIEKRIFFFFSKIQNYRDGMKSVQTHHSRIILHTYLTFAHRINRSIGLLFDDNVNHTKN